MSDPDGPIGSYSWRLATTTTFSIVIADGFTDVRNGDPIPTFARLSGLANRHLLLASEGNADRRRRDRLD